ncbi:proline-rich protein 35 [Mustelus asterias]
MSKDEVTCKINAVYKHKERKPKKPHYIPRPWGKPYNYKCFQCPFTCMEKSHLYNHMKYSLCKNSLSLLIESDWPYKKSNVLSSDLRLLQTATERGRTGKTSGLLESSNTNSVVGDTAIKVTDRWDACSASIELSADVTILEGSGQQARSMREKPSETEATKGCGKAQESRCSPDADMPPPSRNKLAKLGKKAEADFIITDVLSLKDSVMRNKIIPAEALEAKMKHYKLPKNCVSSNGILMEQWRLVTSGQRRDTADVSPPCTSANVIPCYPPPAYNDYQEPQGLNLSVLGVNYPMNHNLFSCLSPGISSNATPPAHMAHLPFLASSAQLIHPHSEHFQSAHLPERSPVPSRFFYPLLFEHTFSSLENRTTADREDRTSTNPAPSDILPSRSFDAHNKTHLRKVPALRPQLSNCSGQVEVFLADSNHKSFLSHGKQEKHSTQSGENTAISHKNKLVFKSPTEACKNSRDTKDVSIKSQALKSSQPRIESFSSLHRWSTESGGAAKEDHRTSPEFGRLSPPGSSPGSNSTFKPGKMSHCLQKGAGKNDSTVLIEDLCKVIHEYRDVEEQLCLVDNEDTPGQKQLRGQLTKIRQELLHIRQALEKTNKQSEGPLDLSVKKSLDGIEKSHKHDTSEEMFENCARQNRESDGLELMDSKSKESVVSIVRAPQTCLADSENKSLDLCIKIHKFERLRTCSDISTGTTSKADLTELPRSTSTERSFINRTTKCEADSSVPLSIDGKYSSPTGHLVSVGEDSKARCEALKRSLPGNSQDEGEKLCMLNPSVAERLIEIFPPAGGEGKCSLKTLARSDGTIGCSSLDA